MTMKVRVRYFASLREALGPDEALELPAGATVAAARDALIARGTAHAQALGRKRTLRCALNQSLCEESALLHDDAELAFFPPITGG